MFAAIRLLIGRGNRLLRHPSSPHTPGARLVAFRSAPRASCSSFSSSSTCPFPTPRSARRPLLPPGFPGVGPDAPCGSAAPLASSRAAATSPYDPYRHAPAAGPGLRSSTATSGWLPRSAHGTAAGVARRPSPPPPRPANATAPPPAQKYNWHPFPAPGRHVPGERVRPPGAGCGRCRLHPGCPRPRVAAAFGRRGTPHHARVREVLAPSLACPLPHLGGDVAGVHLVIRVRQGHDRLG